MTKVEAVHGRRIHPRMGSRLSPALLLLGVAGCAAPAPPAAIATSAATSAGGGAGEVLRYRASGCPLRYEVRATLVRAAGEPVDTLRTFEVSARLSNGIPEHTSGLSILFPNLPDVSAPGSTRAWNLDVANDFQVPATEHIVASVRLDGWLTIRGARAATLSMDGIQRRETHGAATLQGSYVMLASGRLLHATIARSSIIGARMTQEETIEARLVGACDGPTEPPFSTR